MERSLGNERGPRVGKTVTMGEKVGRRQQQGEETRQRILDATIEIAAERGYEGTSMSQIAERAGVSMSSIYWHFADKDAVIAAVLQRSHDRWFAEAALYTMPRVAERLDTQLIDAVRLDIIALTRHPEFLRLGLMLSLERRPDEPSARALFHEFRARSLARLEETFRRILGGAGDQVLPSGHRVSRQLAILVMAAADGLFIAHQVTPDDLDLEELMELFVGGVIDRVLSTVD
jgi:AcrR family transcriptional regulator